MTKHKPSTKASIALAALRGEKIAKLSGQYQIHPNVITKWKKTVEDEIETLFADKRKKENKEKDRMIEELYKIIGQRDVELSWLKKNSSLSYHERLSLAGKDNPGISLRRQAELLDISRSSLYYEPAVNEETLAIMNAIDKIYTEFPSFGHRTVRDILRREHDIEIGRKRTLSLMDKMGLQVIYPRKNPNTSQAAKYHKKFPYLLKNFKILRPNQVWGTDITYIRLKNGFIYLVVILDWYSRYVISRRLSPTLENDFCIEALEEALETARPDIHNSDQGVQFTSGGYIAVLEAAKTKISMDGRGRCFDNIFTERLWRTVKQDNIYPNEYEGLPETLVGLTKYFNDYNTRRPHQSLGMKVPAEVYLA